MKIINPLLGFFFQKERKIGKQQKFKKINPEALILSDIKRSYYKVAWRKREHEFELKRNS